METPMSPASSLPSSSLAMTDKMAVLDHLMRSAPVVPVLVVHDAEAAVPLARALVAGGLRVLDLAALRSSVTAP